MNEFEREAAESLFEASEIIGETIVLLPEGKPVTAILTNHSHEGGINNHHMTATRETINFYLPKSEGFLKNKSRFKARDKNWQVDDCDDDEIAWNGTAFCVGEKVVR